MFLISLFIAVLAGNLKSNGGRCLWFSTGIKAKMAVRSKNHLFIGGSTGGGLNSRKINGLTVTLLPPIPDSDNSIVKELRDKIPTLRGLFATEKGDVYLLHNGKVSRYYNSRWISLGVTDIWKVASGINRIYLLGKLDLKVVNKNKLVSTVPLPTRDEILTVSAAGYKKIALLVKKGVYLSGDRGKNFKFIAIGGSERLALTSRECYVFTDTQRVDCNGKKSLPGYWNRVYKTKNIVWGTKNRRFGYFRGDSFIHCDIGLVTGELRSIIKGPLLVTTGFVYSKNRERGADSYFQRGKSIMKSYTWNTKICRIPPVEKLKSTSLVSWIPSIEITGSVSENIRYGEMNRLINNNYSIIVNLIWKRKSPLKSNYFELRATKRVMERIRWKRWYRCKAGERIGRLINRVSSPLIREKLILRYEELTSNERVLK
jgi:hypothetical protein